MEGEGSVGRFVVGGGIGRVHASVADNLTVR